MQQIALGQDERLRFGVCPKSYGARHAFYTAEGVARPGLAKRNPERNGAKPPKARYIRWNPSQNQGLVGQKVTAKSLILWRTGEGEDGHAYRIIISREAACRRAGRPASSLCE